MLNGWLSLLLMGQGVSWVCRADLYSSTRDVLNAMLERCLICNGTVLSFDELFGRESLVNQEWKALEEARVQYNMSYRFSSWMLHPKSSFGRVSVVVNSVPLCNRAAAPVPR